MANSNERIYIDTSVTPNVGVSIGDIQTVLGSAKNDIGALITAVDSNNKSLINKYAMYKPFRNSALGFASDGARMTAIVASGYGISTTSVTTVQAFLTAFDGGTFDWVYLLPRGEGGGTGGANEWCRILDFNLYNAKSKNPCGTFRIYPTTPVDRNGGIITAVMNKTVPESGWATDGITIKEVYDDVGVSRTYYFGFLLVPESPSTYGYKMITDTVNIFRDQDDTEDLARGAERMYVQKTLSSTFPTGTWTAYPFLTDVSLSSMMDISYSDRNTNLANGMRLYPLAEAVTREIVVVSGLIQINITATAQSIISGNTTTIEWAFTITNNTTSSVTLTGGTIKFRLSGKTYAEALENNETVVSLTGSEASVTIPSNESVRIPAGTILRETSGISVDTGVMWVGYMNGYTQVTGNTAYIVPINPYDNNLEE